jgi:hypothetical protein
MWSGEVYAVKRPFVPHRHPSESSLLPGETQSAKKFWCVNVWLTCLPGNLMFPHRRPGEGRGPATLGDFKSLDPGLRRDDESINQFRQIERSLPRTAVSFRWDDGEARLGFTQVRRFPDAERGDVSACIRVRTPTYGVTRRLLRYQAA